MNRAGIVGMPEQDDVSIRVACRQLLLKSPGWSPKVRMSDRNLFPVDFKNCLGGKLFPNFRGVCIPLDANEARC